MNKKYFIIFIILILILLAGAIYLALWPGKFFGNQNKPIACTMEAKLCPDGSAVGRTGPNCEFSPCPE